MLVSCSGGGGYLELSKTRNGNASLFRDMIGRPSKEAP